MLKYITITGPDDNDNINDLVTLSKKYPLVEWGILFSQSKQGVDRYPSSAWVDELLKIPDINLSAHLCGGYVREIKDRVPFFDDTSKNRFSRVQLNFQKNIQDKIIDNDFVAALSRHDKDFMLGGDFSNVIWINYPRIYPLLDASGGNGIVGKYYAPISTLTGYAGGLGPDNIEEEFKKILDVVGNKDFWIDMESNVRTNNVLDLEKVEFVLEKVYGML